MLRIVLILLFLVSLCSAGKKMKKVQAQLVNQQTQMHAQEAEIKEQMAKILILGEKIASCANCTAVGGAVYTRWGRQDCPDNSATIVYSGLAGGAYLNDRGAAAEFICMSPDPNWTWNETVPTNGGRLWGAEYHPIPANSLGNNPARGHDMPCAVCRSSYSASVMIPARKQCYPGWVKEYAGILSSGYERSHGATRYICLDEDAQDTDGSDNTWKYGKVLLGVQAKCTSSSLMCPPYREKTILPCVVCGK